MCRYPGLSGNAKIPVFQTLIVEVNPFKMLYLALKAIFFRVWFDSVMKL